MLYPKPCYNKQCYKEVCGYLLVLLSYLNVHLHFVYILSRYDAKNNELVSDAIGVAYPVVNGIPNLVPQDGRMLNSDNPIDIGNTKPDSHKR